MIFFFFLPFLPGFIFYSLPSLRILFFSPNGLGINYPPGTLSGNIAFQTEVTMEQWNQRSAEKKKKKDC